MTLRPAFLAVLGTATLFVLACEQPRQVQYLGADPSCQEPPTRPPTVGIQTITVRDTTIVIRPDPAVQPPKAGIFGWVSPTHHWELTYNNQETPTGKATYTGAPGQTVWDPVREDAECKSYKYTLKVWQPGGDTVVVDPEDEVEPYTF